MDHDTGGWTASRHPTTVVDEHKVNGGWTDAFSKWGQPAREGWQTAHYTNYAHQNLNPLARNTSSTLQGVRQRTVAYGVAPSFCSLQRFFCFAFVSHSFFLLTTLLCVTLLSPQHPTESSPLGTCSPVRRVGPAQLSGSAWAVLRFRWALGGPRGWLILATILRSSGALRPTVTSHPVHRL